MPVGVPSHPYPQTVRGPALPNNPNPLRPEIHLVGGLVLEQPCFRVHLHATACYRSTG